MVNPRIDVDRDGNDLDRVVVRRPVVGCLFVDAGLPFRTGPTPAASRERLNYLRTRAAEGRLPQWTTWWDEADVALFPDPQTRSVVSAEQPRLRSATTSSRFLCRPVGMTGHGGMCCSGRRMTAWRSRRGNVAGTSTSAASSGLHGVTGFSDA